MSSIIYCRKSTDRDDRQLNSLEHQLQNCRNTAKRLGLTVIKEFVESASAKTEGTRPVFNEMIAMVQKGGIDCLLFDEPKRLSRNYMDGMLLLSLFDKGKIRKLVWTTRTYSFDEPTDKLMLSFELALSKLDNENRAKDTKNKMVTCAKKGRCLTKAPFGYKNITIKKGEKTVIIDQERAEAVRTMFRMRKDRYNFKDIQAFCREKYPHLSKFNLANIQKIVTNRFYLGICRFSGQEYPGLHEPIVSKELFDAAANAWKGNYARKEETAKIPQPLKGFLIDMSGHRMPSYSKLGRIYYKSQNWSPEKVNVSENYVFEKAADYFKEFDIDWQKFEALNGAIIRDIIKNMDSGNAERTEELNRKIGQLEKRKSVLLDLRLDWSIDENEYRDKLNGINGELVELRKASEKTFSSQDFEKTFEELIELSKSLYQSYLRGDNLRRAELLKNAIIELRVNDKKELVFKENELFSALKGVVLCDGSATENRTPVCGMKTRRPDH